MYSPDGAHDRQFKEKPVLAFDESKPLTTQKEEIRKKLLECLGTMPEPVPLDPVIESTEEHGDFTEYRIRFAVERDVDAVCLLCIPKLGKEKYPLAICLQGHSKGMHVTMGRTVYPGEKSDDGDRDMALQALERGYAALCIDQRGMGERRTEKVWNKDDNGNPRCHITAMSALLLGRTLIGERCVDISRAIDLALTYPEIDGEKIICMGNSGGGTATYYAACLDERISVAIPSCAVCTYRDSIGAMFHCVCNFVPGIAEYVDMGDLATLIAPRKLIIVHGVEDSIFPKKGVYETFETVKKIYKSAGCEENCALVSGEAGHRFYKEKAWAQFDKMVKW